MKKLNENVVAFESMLDAYSDEELVQSFNVHVEMKRVSGHTSFIKALRLQFIKREIDISEIALESYSDAELSLSVEHCVILKGKKLIPVNSLGEQGFKKLLSFWFYVYRPDSILKEPKFVDVSSNCIRFKFEGCSELFSLSLNKVFKELFVCMPEVD